MSLHTPTRTPVRRTAKHLARKWLPPVVASAAKRVFARREPFEHRYKSFSILLPANHLLPQYQQQFLKYDRFLPHLATFIGSDDTVVDIGANVGDTLAGMVEANPSCAYICIEPDDGFYGHLVDNIDRIRRSVPTLKAHAIKSLVGKSVSGVTLEGKGGTKHAVTGEAGGIESRPLDQMLAELPSMPAVRILKSDVDGFDYDVLDSSMTIIRTQGPMIFFECQYFDDDQRSGFERTISILKSEGYCDWTLFDNFGELMLRTDDIGHIYQLMNYVWAQNTGDAPRTIYYFDVLAVQQKDRELVDRALATYRQL